MTKKPYNSPLLREKELQVWTAICGSPVDLNQPIQNEDIGDSGETIEWE